MPKATFFTPWDAEHPHVRAAQRAAKAVQAARGQLAPVAQELFSPGGSPYCPVAASSGDMANAPLTYGRFPNRRETAAARRLARTLREAVRPDLATPAGGVTTRAEDARGAPERPPATSRATRTVHRHTSAPPLRVGIAVDISSSMHADAKMASIAWTLAQAVALTDPEARCATVAFHHSITAITSPGHAPPLVTHIYTGGMGHRLAEAIDALAAGVQLTRPGTGRLLVIASDGYYASWEAAPANRRLAALRETGCAVLQLAFDSDPLPLPGATVLELDHLAKAPAAIGQAATRAFAAAQP